MYQLIDLYWKYEDSRYLPMMKWFDPSSKEILKVPLVQYHFSIKLDKSKYCTGYYKLGEYISCPFKYGVGDLALQCQYCEDQQGFKSAFFYKSEPNEFMKKHLSQKHFVYLAYFNPGILKVGTAGDSRRFTRLIEQDALLYSFIAESIEVQETLQGINIQNLERYISKKFNITESVKSSHKFKYLSQRPNITKALEFLGSYIEKISIATYKEGREEEFNVRLINNPEIVDLTTQLYFPQNYNLLKNELNLSGIFKSLRGRYLIIENENRDFAFDINFLIGREISNIDDFAYNNTIEKIDQQLSMEL